ncbi:MAG: hypothetical protein ABJA98_28005 [Acidobacteriota bacterium]
MEAFGRIGILVNNASAISVTGTLATPMKCYDLMQDINTRGIYLCAQACVPHVLRASNPHILTMAPPLNLKPALVRAVCRLYFVKVRHDAVHARSGGRVRRPGCGGERALAAHHHRDRRRRDVLPAGGDVQPYAGDQGDAARVVFTRDSRGITGHCLMDETVSREVGVTDFERDAVTPGAPLNPDIFLD